MKEIYRVIGRGGLKFERRYYVSPELALHVSARVRVESHDFGAYLRVYLGGEELCVARRVGLFETGHRYMARFGKDGAS